MCRSFNQIKILIVLVLAANITGCAAKSTRSVSTPARPISVMNSRAPKENGIMKATGDAAKGTLDGMLWVVKELLSPFDAVRRGIIDAFGVTSEEPIVKEKNLPPSPYRANQ